MTDAFSAGVTTSTTTRAGRAICAARLGWASTESFRIRRAASAAPTPRTIQRKDCAWTRLAGGPSVGVKPNPSVSRARLRLRLHELGKRPTGHQPERARRQAVGLHDRDQDAPRDRTALGADQRSGIGQLSHVVDMTAIDLHLSVATARHQA